MHAALGLELARIAVASNASSEAHDTLGCALALNGLYAEAVESQAIAVAMAGEQNKKVFEARLKEFEAKAAELR